MTFDPTQAPPPLPIFVPPIAAYAPRPQTPRPSRVWTAIVVPIVTICFAALVSGAVLGALAVQSIGVEGVADRPRFMKWVTEYAASPLGFLAIILPGQLIFLAAAFIAAALSPEKPITKRLGLTRPAMPWWAIPLLLLATPFASFCGDLLTTGLFGEQRSENLELLYGLFRGRTGAALLIVTALVSILPGFSEEILFRGYMQRRLLQRWHPIFAIGLASLLFAGAHFDAMHIVGVWPLGVWLGVITWLSRSIWPSILCHTANNALAVIATNANPSAGVEHLRLDAQGVTLLGVTGAFVVLSIAILMKSRNGNSARQLPL
jgi:membrane protease YdiL (CAAX protease family)